MTDVSIKVVFKPAYGQDQKVFSKVYKFPEIPMVGDTLWLQLEGHSAEVTSRDFDLSDGEVTVWCEADIAASDDVSGWMIDDGWKDES